MSAAAAAPRDAAWDAEWEESAKEAEAILADILCPPPLVAAPPAAGAPPQPPKPSSAPPLVLPSATPALGQSDGNSRVDAEPPPVCALGAGGEAVETKFYASGGRYEGPLCPVTAQPHGSFGVFFYPIGHRYEGPWCKGQKEGERGTFFFANGGRYVGGWKANERHGLGVQFAAAGAQSLSALLCFRLLLRSACYFFCCSFCSCFWSSLFSFSLSISLSSG